MSVKLKLITALFFLAFVAACEKDDTDGTDSGSSSATQYTMDDVARIEEIELDDIDDLTDNDTITYIFNEYGKIDTLIDGEYGNTEANYIVYTYDADGNVVSAESFKGEEKDEYTYTYENGVIIKMERPNEEDDEIEIVDSLFWSNGMLDSVYIYYNGGDYDNSLKFKRYFSYDADGNMIQRARFTFSNGSVEYSDTTLYSNFVEYANFYQDKDVFVTGFSIQNPSKHYQNYNIDLYSYTGGVAEEYEGEFSEITYTFEENENGLLGKITEVEDDGDVDEILYNYTFNVIVNTVTN